MTFQTIFGDGWESIPPNERDRLKWVGVFYRKQIPGAFMMRLRMSSGFSNAEQFRAIAEISEAQDPDSWISRRVSRFSSEVSRLRMSNTSGIGLRRSV